LRIQVALRLLGLSNKAIPFFSIIKTFIRSHMRISKKRETAMITVNKHLTAPVSALALGLALAALASPSFAQRSEQPMSTTREQAVRECNAAAGKYYNSTWQTTQIHSYRSCMAQHGEPE
jgi:hypothetical protein